MATTLHRIGRASATDMPRRAPAAPRPGDPDHCWMDELGQPQRQVAKGDCLYRAGDAFRYLYAVRQGSFMTSRITEDGRHQVTGFHLAGELMALDAIGASSHASDAVALEDSAASAIPYALLASECRDSPGRQHQFHRLLSREIVRDHGVLLLLGTMCAEARLATFLLNLSRRQRAPVDPLGEFTLHMTRDDIGSYLGMRIETVSRQITRFQDRGLLSVRLRRVRILDLQGMHDCVTRRAN